MLNLRTWRLARIVKGEDGRRLCTDYRGCSRGHGIMEELRAGSKFLSYIVTSDTERRPEASMHGFWDIRCTPTRYEQALALFGCEHPRQRTREVGSPPLAITSEGVFSWGRANGVFGRGQCTQQALEGRITVGKIGFMPYCDVSASSYAICDAGGAGQMAYGCSAI